MGGVCRRACGEAGAAACLLGWLPENDISARYVLSKVACMQEARPHKEFHRLNLSTVQGLFWQALLASLSTLREAGMLIAAVTYAGMHCFAQRTTRAQMPNDMLLRITTISNTGTRPPRSFTNNALNANVIAARDMHRDPDVQIALHAEHQRVQNSAHAHILALSTDKHRLGM